MPRKNPSGETVYQVHYTINGKRIKKVVGPRKDVAEKVARQIFLDNQDGPVAQATPVVVPTLAEWTDRFIQVKFRRTAESSQRRYRIYANHFLTFFEKHFRPVTRIDQVTRGQLESHIEDLLKSGKANKTLNGHIQYLRSLFNMAVDDDIIQSSPASKLKSYPESKGERPPYWTFEQVQTILDHTPDCWRDIFQFLYLTGLRKSELIHLRHQDVNLNASPPSIDISSHDGWTTKTGKSRVIPLNPVAVEIAKRQPASDNHPFLFSSVKGNKLDEDKIYQALKKVLGQIGLEGDVHKWRHTFASHLVMKGVGIETVSKLLGHTTLEMTMRYAHLAPDHLKWAVDRL
ncbi:MAG: site-specific integrase [Calditrichaeota bacterium]|nr:site-specific integrase [Candidatus Cloacimonadota bacterium]MCB1046525.1 site-specific integrase [Calditrichota bacterium]MCB9474689.1 site-specific integrase [Candidatus Delongbacteria bacterium]